MRWRPTPKIIILSIVLAACLAGVVAAVTARDVDPSFISRQR